jgi:hypothetical protein
LVCTFDDVRLSRLPRVQLRTNHKLNLFMSLKDVEIQCDVSGVLTSDPLVRFALEDVNGQTLDTMQTRLVGKLSTSNYPLLLRKAPQIDAEPNHDDAKKSEPMPESDVAQVRGFAGRATWKPMLPDYGFYRVRVSLSDNENEAAQIERTTSIAVSRPFAPTRQGEFGWALPKGDEQLALSELVGLVTQVGIHWLKFPLWFGGEDPTRADRLAWFADRIDIQHVKMVGVLDRPPPALRKTFGDAEQIPIGMVFVEAPLWQPAIDPVMARLSLRVRYWQLGADGDNSFVGFRRLAEKIGEIKQYFLKYGQETQVGLPWPWLSETPTGPWDFLSRNASPDLTAAELTSYLKGPNTSNVARWVSLRPLSRQRYNLQTRACDLVERMLAAKMHGAGAIFLPDPLDAEHGVLNADGSPGELLLPWRTTASLLGGAQYLGSIQLPSGSTNHLFQRNQEVVMVVWNRQAVEETMYFGDAIEHFDMWGKSIPHTTITDSITPEQTIRVGPLPSFVTGMNLPIALWRVSLAVEQRNLPSLFGADQTVRYSFKNAFTQSVGGEVRVQTPSDWELITPPTTFRAAAGENIRQRFDVRFRSDAQSGPQLVRLDFRITADRDYVFSAYQPLNVGIGDVSIETMTRFTDSGDLIVEQTFTNQTDEFVSFNCLLFAPGRRRERIQVLNLGRGRHTASFVLPRGDELIGETLLLRAEELDGDRILNYRILPQQ